jgi:putative endonuclease
MSKHSKIGIKGEQIAASFLLNKGYIILHHNWHSGKKEVDIIAEKDGILVIVEVKTRSSYDVSFPEEAVTHKKQQFLRFAAQSFSDAHPEYRNIRFDIISILMDDKQVKEIVHFEEAFY